jgi:hypothetical protein
LTAWTAFNAVMTSFVISMLKSTLQNPPTELLRCV